MCGMKITGLKVSELVPNDHRSKALDLISARITMKFRKVTFFPIKVYQQDLPAAPYLLLEVCYEAAGQICSVLYRFSRSEIRKTSVPGHLWLWIAEVSGLQSLSSSRSPQGLTNHPPSWAESPCDWLSAVDSLSSGPPPGLLLPESWSCSCGRWSGSPPHLAWRHMERPLCSRADGLCSCCYCEVSKPLREPAFLQRSPTALNPGWTLPQLCSSPGKASYSVSCRRAQEPRV